MKNLILYKSVQRRILQVERVIIKVVVKIQIIIINYIDLLMKMEDGKIVK